MCTCASIVEVRVAFVAHGAVAPVPGAVDGVEALAARAPAGEVGRVLAGGAAVVDVANGPVEHEGHREVVGAVEEDLVGVVEPLGVDEEHVVARRSIGGESG